MSDWSDLLDIAGDLVGDVGGDQLLKQGEKLFKKLGLNLNTTEKTPDTAVSQPQSLAEQRMQSERLVPEPLIPEKMEPENMKPDSPVQEGESTVPERNMPIRKKSTTESDALQYLTNIASRGLGGAIMADEILEAPLSVRRGYMARCRRKIR
ncbi:MAG: hypothetical protein ACOX6P_00385 [Candidatus Merdivicinus sp.]|jgi:hypothetical protein